MVCCVNLSLYQVPGGLLTILFLKQTAELLFRWKTKLWTIAGLSSLCIFSQAASASTSLQGPVSVF